MDKKRRRVILKPEAPKKYYCCNVATYSRLKDGYKWHVCQKCGNAFRPIYKTYTAYFS